MTTTAWAGAGAGQGAGRQHQRPDLARAGQSKVRPGCPTCPSYLSYKATHTALPLTCIISQCFDAAQPVNMPASLMQLGIKAQPLCKIPRQQHAVCACRYSKWQIESAARQLEQSSLLERLQQLLHQSLRSSLAKTVSTACSSWLCRHLAAKLQMTGWLCCVPKRGSLTRTVFNGWRSLRLTKVYQRCPFRMRDFGIP